MDCGHPGRDSSAQIFSFTEEYNTLTIPKPLYSSMAHQPFLLIVDDETNVALTLQLIFEREGYAVRTANSCAGALKLLENGHVFDAVITDLNMEKENIGLEVARAALRLHPRPAVVLCTGYASVEIPRPPCK